ncbi:TonB-linked SusC/RagA family outer membrane protein [Pontibacter ummariensis]|uniref:TonB-linked outer membrane protein, SusC/RagA family n=1 Tax=Pontibacter ummariensis TaxID=1610492 RepID=A0A239LQD7_9BACT|nr:TonB-dependent receptor [Pontibacter ummariensis]PRY02929.1 TonB-linked SusC/RagA family outer membrane protein [Pontibacter ummariensis]SNT32112.1 TonB-linked outer membrane protein, SusC/RagA family [Pontibacter ummariensis]
MKNYLLEKVRYLFILHLLFLSVTSALAQGVTVQGKVTDEGGAVLPGVTVVLKGTSIAAPTGADGVYSINVPDGSGTLIFSYIGFQNKEVPINNRSTVNVQLGADAKALEEVVVVGYGSQLKKEVTGAVQTISTKEIKDIPVSQVTQKVQGRVAGVQINQTTGKPGQGMSVRIRGQLSVTGGSDPLYVVDGFPITGSIGAINPDEIQEITILKDAASTSLYGSRAANGVVLITTKKGAAGQTNVSFSAFAGVQQVPERGRIDMMDAVEFAQFKKEYYEDAGQPVPEIFQDPSQYEGKNNDWYDALLRTAPIRSYNLTVTSNKDKLNTALVAGIFDQEGVVLNNEYKRYSARLNSDYEVSDKIRIGLNVAPSYVFDNTPRTDGDRGTGILFNALHTWPIMPIYDENGELTMFNRFPANTGNIYAYPNWVRSANELVNETETINLLSNAYIQYKPIDGLVLKSTFNVETMNSKFMFFNPSTATSSINTPIPTTAVSVRDNLQTFTWLNENLATYSKSFDEHSFELLGGFTNQQFRFDRTRLQADTYADDRLPTVQGAININRGGTYSGVEEWSLTSFLSRLTYNYKGKYLFSAAVRSDGSSRFGENNRWGIFPSASIGWVVSDEDFLHDIEQISFAKIRASYGVTGNNNIGNYTQYALVNNTVNAVFGDNIAPGAAVVSLANNNLGWETTKQFDFGLDLGLFNDRIQFMYDFYKKTTTNLLYSVQVPQESGFSNFNDNIGEIDFWGHEFALSTRNIEGKLLWTTNANISFNRNKVIALADGIDRVYGTFHITQVGQPFGQFYGLIDDGLYMNEEDLNSSPQVPGRSTVGSIKLRDVNGDGIITYGGDNDDRSIIGNPFPKFTYGIVNNFQYGKFDLSIVGSGSYGNQLLVRHLYSTANLDGVFNMVDDVKYRFRSEENPGKGVFGTTVGGGNVTGIERDWMSSHFIADASYFTIKNITIGYTLGAISKFIKSARVYTSIQQAWVFTNYWGGPNPETSAQGDGNGNGGNLSQGIDFSNYPVPRTFTLGANLNF